MHQANQNMTSSLNLMKFLESWEGLELEVYLCQAGVPTIGIGTTRPFGKPLDVNLKITKDQAYEMKLYDMQRFEETIKRLVTVPLNQHQFDALVSLTYNIGPTAFQNSSALARLNVRDYAAVPSRIKLWNKVRQNGVLQVSRGLVRRREAEALMFEKGIYRGA